MRSLSFQPSPSVSVAEAIRTKLAVFFSFVSSIPKKSHPKEDHRSLARVEESDFEGVKDAAYI